MTHATILPVPQLGEGLREVRVVELHRAAGEAIAKGDVLYTVETDKSVVELESPFSGHLAEWRIAAGDVVPVGAAAAVVSSDEPVEAAVAVADGEATAGSRSGVAVPPRTRAYAREKGIGAEELATIAAADGRKLYPADIDAHIAGRGAAAAEPSGSGATAEARPFVDRPVTPVQRALNYRFRRSADLVIQASLALEVDAAVFERRDDGPRWQSAQQQLAFAVAATAADHPRFRSTMIGEDLLREYDHVNLGIAVARPNGDLATAALRGADAMTPPEFIRAYARQLRSTIVDGDQAAGVDIHVLLTTLIEYGIEDAMPSLVAPANSAVFLGSRTRAGTHRLVLVFDHRIVNGVDAARFLSDVVTRLPG